MKLEGEVSSVIYVNYETGYTIVDVFTGLQYVTCVGYFPELFDGERIILEGEFIQDPKYGEQFKAEKCACLLPNKRDEMIAYLSSGLFYGVKDKTATKIVDALGDKTFDVLANDPVTLSKVRGIGLARAVTLVERFNSLIFVKNLIIELQSHELSISTILKLYKAYGERTKEVLESNPYQIIKDIDGFGFLTADKIALKLGYEKKGDERIKAGIMYTVTDVADKLGHTYLFHDDLLNRAMDLLSLDRAFDEDLVETCLRKCESNNEIISLEVEGREVIMSKVLYDNEKYIAKKLMELANSSENVFYMDLDQDLNTYQKMNKIQLDDKQLDAIKNSLMYGVSVITGGPGTGKTTIIKAICAMLINIQKTFALCAPTGRAAKRMTESTGFVAKTIHRLLGLTVEDGVMRFRYNEDNHLNYDVIIVDESSMCDTYITRALLRALSLGTRIIFVGDKDQLPSVGAGNVLSDMINSQVIPVSFLKRIFRQDEGSMISINAHEVNSGKMIKLDNKSTDFFFSEVDYSTDLVKTLSDMVSNRIPKYFKVTRDDIQILAPAKKGNAGIDKLNEQLQDILNPLQENLELVIGTRKFRVGDKVIHIKNDYEMVWQMPDGTSGSGVFNGEMGVVRAIDIHQKMMLVEYDDERMVSYRLGDFDEVQLAYAITVHKSQGSEFKVAVLVLLENNPMLATRNLLYTGITRGKQAVVILGSKQIVSKMIANNIIIKRNSMLLTFLREEYEYSR